MSSIDPPGWSEPFFWVVEAFKTFTVLLDFRYKYDIEMVKLMPLSHTYFKGGLLWPVLPDSCRFINGHLEP